MATQTQSKGKFVKYWEHETPEILKTEKNEVRVYGQHGKIQIYPIVQSAARGVGKGATINLDTFTKNELRTFSSYLTEMLHQGPNGYNDNKKYWENEEPAILSSSKNEIRFYIEHGKLQVFPKIETGRGIGRGATINFEGIDFDMEAYAIFEAINDVVDSFLEAPEFNTPPESTEVKVEKNEHKVVESKKENDNTKIKKIEKILNLIGGDESKLEQLLSLIENPEIEDTKNLDSKEETQELTEELEEDFDNIEEESYESSDEQIESKNDETEVVSSKKELDSPQNYQSYATSLDNEQLVKEFHKNCDIAANKYNPELTIALFEELKSRKNKGLIKF